MVKVTCLSCQPCLCLPSFTPSLSIIAFHPCFLHRAFNLTVTLSEPGAVTAFLYTTAAAANLTFGAQTAYPPSPQASRTVYLNKPSKLEPAIPSSPNPYLQPPSWFTWNWNKLPPSHPPPANPITLLLLPCSVHRARSSRARARPPPSALPARRPPASPRTPWSSTTQA